MAIIKEQFHILWIFYVIEKNKSTYNNICISVPILVIDSD